MNESIDNDDSAMQKILYFVKCDAFFHFPFSIHGMRCLDERYS